jgi:hypothetical protein
VRVSARGTSLVEPVPDPLVWLVRVRPVEWFLLFRWEALLASSTERLFTLDATRAGPYSHDSYQEILDSHDSYQEILDIRVRDGLSSRRLDYVLPEQCCSRPPQ